MVNRHLIQACPRPNDLLVCRLRMRYAPFQGTHTAEVDCAQKERTPIWDKFTEVI
nr:MAG TPA: Protein of unknown function (DUF3288) [Caudoviricetes sp.]